MAQFNITVREEQLDKPVYINDSYTEYIYSCDQPYTMSKGLVLGPEDNGGLKVNILSFYDGTNPWKTLVITDDISDDGLSFKYNGLDIVSPLSIDVTGLAEDDFIPNLTIESDNADNFNSKLASFNFYITDTADVSGDPVSFSYSISSTSGCEPNLIIEGIGGIDISSEQELVDLLYQVPLGNITYFNITDDIVEAKVETGGGELRFINEALKANQNIKSVYYSGGDLSTGYAGFEGSSLERIVTLGTLTPEGRAFRNCVNLNSEDIIYNDITIDGIGLKSYMFENIDVGPVFDLTALTYMDVYNSPRAMFKNTSSYVLDLSNLTTLDYVDASTFLYVFSDVTGEIRLDSLTSLGPSASTDNRVFGDDGTGLTIYINSVMETINGGGPHSELVRAASVGATIIYV